MRCPACGYAFSLIAYAPQDTSIPCPSCKTAVRLYLPVPPPEAIRFSWEYSREPAPATGVHFLPRLMSKLLPGVAVSAAALILVASLIAASFVLSSGSGNMTIKGDVYSIQSGNRHALQGVRVEVSDLSLITFTDKNGAFELQDIKIGEHTLMLTLANYSVAEYHIVAFPVLGQSFELEMKLGSGHDTHEAGQFRSPYDIDLALYSAAGELMLISSFLIISAYMIVKRRHLVFVLASFLLGILCAALMTNDLTIAWYLLIAASGLSFAGIVLAWLGRDEFAERTEWTIEQPTSPP